MRVCHHRPLHSSRIRRAPYHTMAIAFMRLMLFALLAIHAEADTSGTLLDHCEVKLEPIGCFSDNGIDRAMEHEILNARDPSSKTYAGFTHGWGGEYATFLPKFLCQCAKIAIKQGYRIIGMQFYGECWSSFDSHRLFLKHGLSKSCTNQNFKTCGPDDVLCTGERTTNFIYRIAPTACDTYYKPIGCFKDNLDEPRPLPSYVMNERDYSVWNWNGRLIEWKNWNVYSSYMICRCAEMAREMGHDLFGVQFYGECWTGKKGVDKYARDGLSDRCLAKDFDRCPYNSYHCVGKDHTNRVYQLTPEPEKMSTAIAESDASKYVV